MPCKSIDLFAAGADNPYAPIAFVYRRTVHERVGLFDERFSVVGDWDFNLRFLQLFEIGVIRPAAGQLSLASPLRRFDLRQHCYRRAGRTRRKINRVAQLLPADGLAAGPAGPGLSAQPGQDPARQFLPALGDARAREPDRARGRQGPHPAAALGVVLHPERQPAGGPPVRQPGRPAGAGAENRFARPPPPARRAVRQRGGAGFVAHRQGRRPLPGALPGCLRHGSCSGWCAVPWTPFSSWKRRCAGSSACPRCPSRTCGSARSGSPGAGSRRSPATRK